MSTSNVAVMKCCTPGVGCPIPRGALDQRARERRILGTDNAMTMVETWGVYKRPGEKQ